VPRLARGARYSPVVRRIAAEHRVDLAQVTGTGRGGRVRKQDVLAFVTAGPGTEPPLHIESPYRPEPVAPVATDLGGVTEPLSRMRTVIGEQMRRALDTAAHCTTIFECDMSVVERRRRELGLTALPLVAGSVIETLRDFPAINATLDGARLTRYERVHLGIAVSLGEEGLIVPVIHDAQDLTPQGLARRIKDLAGRARSRELTPDEVRGGTFTITNPGALGAIAATPVINVPQVAILDLEAIVKRPVVVTDDRGGDAISIRPMANLCLSWDHRAIDGAYAAQFLAALRRRIETDRI
jgi:pyruvate/2-oxoglutarate dehydrogenase complex dihydrolipoamide acyltransferase (E2) component